MSSLYVIGTPIGNLEDISLRALKILGQVDIILCEDTRVTRKILDKYEIKTSTLSYHVHSKLSRTNEIIEHLKSGKNCALVSDAGTPGISDPGTELVRTVRESCKDEIENGDIKIEAIPGPSALAAALSIAGVDASSFVFLGFLPHKKGRESLFREIAIEKRSAVFYESPHRLLKSLKSLDEHLADSKKVTVCKELTKIYEQVIAGQAKEVLNYFLANPDKVRGEFVIIVSFYKKDKKPA